MGYAVLSRLPDPSPLRRGPVECGPGSTFPLLEAALKDHGYALTDITDVFLTHIHLDHAGAAGRLSQTGSRHPCPSGWRTPLTNPAKTAHHAPVAAMGYDADLWGEFSRLLLCLEVMRMARWRNLKIAYPRPWIPLVMPNHHYAYFFKDVCFSGVSPACG